MITDKLIKDILNLYKSNAPLGDTPSFISELKNHRVFLENVEEERYIPPWEKFASNQNKKNEDSDEDFNELLGQGISLTPRQRSHTLSRSSCISSLDSLKLLKSVWSDIEKDYKNKSLLPDQEKQLFKIIEFLTSFVFITDKKHINEISTQFKNFLAPSPIPNELKSISNPFINLENDFLNGLLFGEMRSFLRTHPPSISNFLNDVFDKNINLMQHMVSLLPPSSMETNIDWFLSNMDINAKQKDAFKIFLNISLLPSDISSNLFSFFEELPSFKQDDFSDKLDLAFSLPLKTFQSLFKPETGFIHKKGISSSRMRSVAESPFSGVIKKSTLRNFKMYFPERIDFLQNISVEYIQEVDTKNVSVEKDDFSHIGQDVNNLLAILSQSQRQNFKILITGKPGSGKTSLVHYALNKTKRMGVTLDENEMDGYAIRSLRNISSVLGNSVIFIDGVEELMDDELVSAVKGQSKSTEIWSTSDPQSIKAQAISSFDLIINIPTFPFEKRKQLAQKLFDDDKLSDKVAKICSTPGEIVKLSEWSRLSGQKSWQELSVIASSIVQASIKSKNDYLGSLPISLHQPSDTNYGFNHVIGCNNIVNQAKKIIAGYHHPESFKLVGAKPPKGVLLTGGPGLGKTYLVKAMAHEAGVPLLIASSSSMSSEPEMITSVFAEARRHAPCILFLDEIDALGASGQKKDGSAAEPARQAILNRLLTEIDGFEGLSDVMVIGATHRSDVLDDALVRSGRLGWHINFTPPDLKSRLSLWKYYTKKSPLDENIDLNRIARLSVGMTPADIHESVNIASLNAAFNLSKHLTQKDLEKSIDQIQWGFDDENKEVLEKELERTAIHEAGHAVMSHLLNMPIERVTVRPTWHSLGFVQPMHDESKVHKTKKDCEDEIFVLFAGSIAEQECLSSRGIGSSSDLEKIRSLVQTMYRDEGMGTLPEGVDYMISSPQTKRFIEVEEQKFISSCHEKAIKMISSNKNLIVSLANELIKHREMNSREIKQFFENFESDKKIKFK